LPGEPWEQKEAARRHLAEYATNLEKMREAARIGGPARYPIDFHDGSDVLLPHLGKLRHAARLLDLEARVKAREGDARGVAESLHTMLAAAKSLEREPIFDSQLVRIVDTRMATETLEDLLPHVEFSGEDLARLQADIASPDQQASFRRVLMGDRVMEVMAFQSPQRFREEMGIAAKAFAAITRRDELVMSLKYIDRYIDASQKPWPQAWEDAEAAVQAHQAESGQPREILIEVFASAEARGDAAAAALAVERYRLRHGRLPEKLSDLVPEFLTTAPIDPYDRKPLRYVVQKDGYTIYSIGQNGIDEGGKEIEGSVEGDVTFSVEQGEPPTK
jgi:hypothetical protein